MEGNKEEIQTYQSSSEVAQNEKEKLHAA